jgi:hypothetical protein
MESAKVTSIDALRSFRAALIKFAETAEAAITDADSDVRSTLTWLERDQLSYWNNQIRKRHDALERAKEALRHKEVFKSPHGGRASVVDEQRMVAKCKVALAEAEQKLINTKRSAQRLHKQMMEFSGQIQRLATAAQSDIPAAVADLDRMVALLDEYVSMRAPAAAASSTESESAAMTRAAPARDSENKYKSLRAHTPTPATRAGLLPGLVTFGPWKSLEIKVAQLEAIEKQNMGTNDVEGDQLVTLARGVNESELIYLQRMDPAFPNDSGWHIGRGDVSDEEAKFVALKVAEVVSMRPDFARLLSFPSGSLIALNSDGVAAILDSNNRDWWTDIRGKVEAGAPQDATEPPEEDG